MFCTLLSVGGCARASIRGTLNSPADFCQDMVGQDGNCRWECRGNEEL